MLRAEANARAAPTCKNKTSEIFGLWCPLTALEQWLEIRGNVSPYRGPFLLHYLDAVVYPNIPPKLLIAAAVVVCILNLGIYVPRLRVRHSLG